MRPWFPSPRACCRLWVLVVAGCSGCLTAEPEFHREHSSTSSDESTRVTSGQAVGHGDDGSGEAGSKADARGDVSAAAESSTTTSSIDTIQPTESESTSTSGVVDAGDSADVSPSSTSTDNTDAGGESSQEDAGSTTGTGSDATTGNATESTSANTVETGSELETETTSSSDSAADEAEANSESTTTGEFELPTILSLGPPTETDLLNDSNASLARRTCPEGQAATGISGTQSGTTWFGRLQVHCATLTLSGELDPATKVVSADILSAQGGILLGGLPWSVYCPAGRVISGVGIALPDSRITALFLDCAKLEYADELAPQALAIGDRVRVSSTGDSMVTATNEMSCPAGHVQAGAITRAELYISSLGLICRPWSTMTP